MENYIKKMKVLENKNTNGCNSNTVLCVNRKVVKILVLIL
jgi:hypothetical protein